ncbi:tyrosinase family protein [Lysobacter korlensis]|uniref:Tyrosinase family protein n=1 Tax=Lysobacter korlensis TaxID=553636 RepID=A0ABV6RIB9_9GAMM
MTSVSRRSFIRGLATVPVGLWLAGKVHANTTHIRYDLSSPEGHEMLRILAQGVAKMKALPGKRPQGWLWQWYTHFVNGNTTKADEISRLLGGPTTTLGMFAEETWNTCQSHAGQNANNFMPWHRMYVYFFEEIVREITGRPDFALPYWNYTSHDPAKRGVVPVEFRLPNDPLFGTFYRSFRTSLANSGQPIHQGQPGDPMDISVAMAKTHYSTIDGVQGFCRAIDSGVHGRIHVLTGTSKNMGAVPYAAQDALFWVHHANIDRMWASWNANGNPNPTSGSWRDREFVFVDGKGQRVTGRLRDFFDTNVLGYRYDRHIGPDGREGSATLMTASAARRSVGTVAERIGSAPSVELAARPIRSIVRLEDGKPATALDPSGSRRTWLIVKDLHTWAQPEVLYHVYLSPRGGGIGPRVYAGNIHFFDAEFHDHGNSNLDEALGENFYSFDVTEILQRIAANGGASKAPLEVAFVPGGQPTPGAKPLVGTIQLIWQ